MARTLNGNLTGRAARGVDDIYQEETEHSKRLHIASEKVKAIIGDNTSFLSLMIKLVNDEKSDMLETFEIIISQCEQWDAEHPANVAQDIEREIDSSMLKHQELDEMAQDWQQQVTELRGGL